MRLMLVLLLSSLAAFVPPASPAYNENADAKAEIRDALQVAAQPAAKAIRWTYAWW